jgi:hypothetical protein
MSIKFCILERMADFPAKRVIQSQSRLGKIMGCSYLVLRP